MVHAIFKTRPNKLHVLLAIQFYCYASYKFTIEEKLLRYLYLNKTMDFDGPAFSWLTVFMTICSRVGALLVLPFLSHICKMKDILDYTRTARWRLCFMLAMGTISTIVF